MPTKLCAEPRCGNPARLPNNRCDEHARKVERERSQHRRDTKGPRVYDKAKWRNTRRKVLHEQPLCPGVFGEECGRIAEHVDHVQPLEDGGAPFDRGNLSGLCADCHMRKTAVENSQRGQRE